MISEDVGLVVEHCRLSSQQPRSPNTKAYRWRWPDWYPVSWLIENCSKFKTQTLAGGDPRGSPTSGRRHALSFRERNAGGQVMRSPSSTIRKVTFHKNQKATLLLSHCLPVYIEASAKFSTSSSRAQAPEWRPALRIVHTEANPPTTATYHDVLYLLSTHEIDWSLVYYCAGGTSCI